MSSIAETQELAAQIREHQQLEASVVLFSTVILVYDYILTFDQEVSLIWFHRSSWGLTSVLFLVNRYLPFLNIANSVWHTFLPGATPASCKIAYLAIIWMGLLGLGITEIVLTFRTWAIWQRSGRLAVLLPVLFLAVWGPIFTVLGVFAKTLQLAPPPYPWFLGCNVVAASPILSIVWALLIVYEAGIRIWVAYRGYISYRSGSNTALFKAIYRDGILYYLYLFVLSVINIIVIKVSPRNTFLLASVECVIHSILGSRMILHIRKIARSDPFHNGELSSVGHTDNDVRLNPIQFAQ